MEFTKAELELIAAAKKKSSDANVKRVLVLIATMIGLGLMLTGRLDPDRFAYATVVAVFVAIALPQFGGKPQYEDLVRLLERKSKSEST